MPDNVSIMFQCLNKRPDRPDYLKLAFAVKLPKALRLNVIGFEAYMPILNKAVTNRTSKDGCESRTNFKAQFSVQADFFVYVQL